MNPRCFFTVTVILTIIIANSIHSQNTYYVNGSDTTASDYNSGTSPDSAWKTIKRAGMYSVGAVAGDTVIVKPAVYRETLKPSNSGNATNGNITFRSEPQFGAKLIGIIPLDSIITEGAIGQLDTLWHQLDATLNNVWKIQLDSTKHGYVEAYRNTQRMPSFKSLDGGGFQLPLDGSYIYSKQVSAGKSFVSDSLNTLFVFLEDTVSSPNIYSWCITKNYGAWLKDKSFIKIQGFEIDSFAEVGILVQGCNHIVIEGNYSHHNGRTGIAINWSNSNIQISNNEVAYNGIGLGYSSGISVYRATSPSINVIGNVSHHNADFSNMHSDGNGFIFDVCADGGLNGGGILKNNIAFENQGSGIRIHRSKNCEIKNNTTFRNGSGELSPTEMDIGDEFSEISSDSSLVFDNIIVENNIFFVRPGGNAFNIRLQNYTNGNIISNYNDCYRNNADSTTTIFFVKVPLHTGSLNLREFQNLTETNTNSFVADPLFVNQLEGDFHLTSISPCINTGNPDMDDKDPDGTRNDIGAYYYHYPSGIVSDGNVPIRFSLYQNFPNPFNPTTKIRFSLAKTSLITLKIFDVLGREVTTLVDRELSAGEHSVIFNYYNLSSGVYICRLQAGQFVQQKKMELIK